MTSTRRETLKFLQAGALGLAGMPLLSRMAAAQADDVVVTNNYQNFKRGKVVMLHPDRRVLNVDWEDTGRIKMRAASLVTNYDQLKEGMIVDCNYFDYVDVLIGKKTPESEARAKALVAKGARLTGIPTTEAPIRMWSMSGMVTQVDQPRATLYLVNASNGLPEAPSPDSGEVIQLPQVLTEAGRKNLAMFKPGDYATTVWTHQTAIKVTIIR